MSANLCRVCQVPVVAPRTLCQACVVYLYPEAYLRFKDTQHARSVARQVRTYDDARIADEADAPIKRRGRE